MLINTQIEYTTSERIAELSVYLKEIWGTDCKTQDLHLRLENFILQIDNNDQELREIVLGLTRRFNYYSKLRVNELLLKFYNQINQELMLVEDRTIYSKIDRDGQSKIDSSNTILEEFKICNSISNHFSLNLSQVSIRQLEQIDNVVIFDDIIGSGNTLIKFLKPHKEKLASTSVCVYVFCFVVLEDALKKIKEFSKWNNIRVEIKYDSLQSKAFKKGYIYNASNNDNKEKVRDHERSKKMRPVLGYGNCQALVAFYRNTPNNTLPTFWWESQKWEGLFPRDNRKPLFMKNKTDRSSSVAYNLSKKEADKN